ncbi:hypothetical protein SRHO_G00166780 [Serrasalmus rhombeus]
MIGKHGAPFGAPLSAQALNRSITSFGEGQRQNKYSRPGEENREDIRPLADHEAPSKQINTQSKWTQDRKRSKWLSYKSKQLDHLRLAAKHSAVAMAARKSGTLETALQNESFLDPDVPHLQQKRQKEQTAKQPGTDDSYHSTTTATTTMTPTKMADMLQNAPGLNVKMRAKASLGKTAVFVSDHFPQFPVRLAAHNAAVWKREQAFQSRKGEGSVSRLYQRLSHTSVRL